MQYPQLNGIRRSRQWTERFTGLNRRPRAEDGAFAAMGNMTGEPWPLLSSRKKRGLVAELAVPRALAALGKLAWIDGGTLYFDGEATAINDLSEEAGMLPKRITAMGPYLLILPDKRYYNTMNPLDHGRIERLWSSEGQVTIAPFSEGGSSSGNGAGGLSTINPGTGTDGDYVKISCAGIGTGLSVLDGVRVSGIAYTGSNDILGVQVEALNGTHIVLALSDDFIVVAGKVNAQYVQSTGTVRADRRMPEMDYLFECGNRLWGCRCGEQDGVPVNRVYASALGDFRNWEQYMGVSTDSFSVAVGSDGPFTGAAAHRGTPHFFKADCVHKLYGDKPGNFQMQVMACDGVRPGCADSLAAYNGRLYYVGVNGVELFDSLPENVGAALGDAPLRSACAGQAGGKYYLSAKDGDGQFSLYVLDTERNVWHRQDDSRALAFAELDGEIYMLLTNGLLYALNGTAGETEPQEVTWFAETAAMGYECPEHKSLNRFLLRLRLGAKAECRVFVQYDSDGLWHFKGAIAGADRVKTCLLPVIPRRCDHFGVRLEGHGDMRLYGMAREWTAGRD